MYNYSLYYTLINSKNCVHDKSTFWIKKYENKICFVSHKFNFDIFYLMSIDI